MGLSRAEIERVLGKWPDSAEPIEQDWAVSNVLNHLLGYPHHAWDAWKEYISVEPTEVESILVRWYGLKEYDPSPAGYVDRFR